MNGIIETITVAMIPGTATDYVKCLMQSVVLHHVSYDPNSKTSNYINVRNIPHRHRNRDTNVRKRYRCDVIKLMTILLGNEQ